MLWCDADLFAHMYCVSGTGLWGHIRQTGTEEAPQLPQFQVVLRECVPGKIHTR